MSLQSIQSDKRKRSLGQGNVFTPLCHSVHGGRGSAQPPPVGWPGGGLGRPPTNADPPGIGQTPPDADPPGLGRPPRCRLPWGWADPPPQGWADPPDADAPPNTVNKRAVRILLEFILVFKCEHPHMLPCNPFFIGENNGLYFVTCEHSFVHPEIKTREIC